MIPPRGCAYICMVHRQDAYRALQKLSTGSYKIGSKVIKVCVKNVRWLIFALFYNFFWEYVLNVALLADRLGPQQRGETGVQAILGCGPWGHVYSVGEGQTGWPGWFCRGRHDWPGDRQQRWEEFPCLGAENCILCNLYICSYTRHLTLFFFSLQNGNPRGILRRPKRLRVRLLQLKPVQPAAHQVRPSHSLSRWCPCRYDVSINSDLKMSWQMEQHMFRLHLIKLLDFREGVV